MACLVSRLKDLIQEYEHGNGNCNEEKNFQTKPLQRCCYLFCPPPILVPTAPQPVRPLQWPLPKRTISEPKMSTEEAERIRYANFYNNYNIDWHSDSARDKQPSPDPRTDKWRGVTTDGKSPRCSDSENLKKVEEDKGCPTGFKLCSMKVTPFSNCHPCGAWCAEIEPCPKKPKKKTGAYVAGACKRPCCKHWKPKDGDCEYTDPCKAHCFNHKQ
ncbi:uncharacterized protein LOC132703487 [Cylas formicarius]|uniref:uncharacterized protein LOC132703487 n=1 Tax=Cylas formicarius TaxID=197179 RepID=UPI00295853A0|nr:uncharacterized protein LOC132703487 [Cylas formicarius]